MGKHHRTHPDEKSHPYPICLDSPSSRFLWSCLVCVCTCVEISWHNFRPRPNTCNVCLGKKDSGELSPGPVTRKPINRRCRHLLVTRFHGALFSQQQTIDRGRNLCMRQTLTRHLCADLHGHKDHVLACRLLAGSGVLADTHFYNPPNFKQKKKKKSPWFFWEGKG